MLRVPILVLMVLACVSAGYVHTVAQPQSALAVESSPSFMTPPAVVDPSLWTVPEPDQFIAMDNVKAEVFRLLSTIGLPRELQVCPVTAAPDVTVVDLYADTTALPLIIRRYSPLYQEWLLTFDAQLIADTDKIQAILPSGEFVFPGILDVNAVEPGSSLGSPSYCHSATLTVYPHSATIEVAGQATYVFSVPQAKEVGRLRAVRYGHHMVQYYFDHRGKPTAIVDSTGTRYSVTVTADEVTVQSLDSHVTYTYDEQGLLSKVQTTSGHEFIKYDECQRLVRRELGDQIASYDYDHEGRVISFHLGSNSWQLQYPQDTPYTVITDDNSQAWYCRMADDRLEAVYAPDGTVVQYHGPSNRRIELYQSSGHTEIQFDNGGRLIRFQQGSAVTTWGYAGRSIRRTDPGGTDTCFTWDLQSRLARVETDSGWHNYSYDQRSRLIAAASNSSTVYFSYLGTDQISRIVSNGTVTSYEYDRDGVLMRVRVGNGDSYQLSYNSDGLPTRINWTETGTTYLYWDGQHWSGWLHPDGSGWQLTYDDKGLLTEIHTHSDQWTVCYDIDQIVGLRSGDARWQLERDHTGTVVAVNIDRIWYTVSGAAQVLQYQLWEQNLALGPILRVLTYLYGAVDVGLNELVTAANIELRIAYADN